MQKQKTTGSIFINMNKENKTPEVEDGLKKCLKFLTKNKIYFSISLDKEEVERLAAQSDKYVGLVAYFSTFKKTDKDKDMFVIPKVTVKKDYPKSKPVAKLETDDEIPFC